jgi:dihydrofolate synthase/folylpolyglutamate synthase
MGLSRIKTVGNRADLFTFASPVITVAGTNGKGSTVTALAKLLQSAGRQVATYTSPHLLRFNERIQINGICATDQQLCTAFAKVEQLRGDIPLTFFEFTTLAALILFKEAANEQSVIILEVGLGGELDAVNAVQPSMAIITSIGFDHQEWLGDPLASIALAKAGILRPGIPVLLGNTAVMEPIISKAKQLHNQLYCAGKDFGFIDQDERTWQFQEEVIKLPIIKLPANSVSLAMAAYTILNSYAFSLPPIATMVNVLEDLTMVGRFYLEKLGNITIIFDVAHNAPASEWLARKLSSIKENGRIIAVWASLSDKDLAGIIGPMKAIVDIWSIGNLQNTDRTTPVTVLKNQLQAQNIQNIHVADNMNIAFDQAVAIANLQDHIVVFGSFYTVAEIFQRFSNGSMEIKGLCHG